MRFNSLTKLMFQMWKTSLDRDIPQQTICLLGSPGIGKTSTKDELAAFMTEAVRANPEMIYGQDKRCHPATIPEAINRALDLSSMLPEDLNGLPFREEETTKFCAPQWLHELCRPNAFGVLVLDDLPAASPMMQVAARQISLERRVHDHKLAPGVFIVVTGNRREDKSAASTLPAHFRNSVMLLDVDLDVDEWAKWYGRQPHHDPVIAAFLRFKQERLSMLPSDQDKRGAFATPRTWAKLGAQFDVAEATDTLFDVASGLVGEGVATEFAAFVRIRSQLVDPEKVFDNPEKTLPKPETLNSPDKLVAMATSLGEIGAMRSKRGKGKVQSEAPLKLLRALAWATQTSREYCGAGVSTFIANGGSLPDMVRVARANRDDPVVGGLLSFLKSALMEGN